MDSQGSCSVLFCPLSPCGCMLLLRRLAEFVLAEFVLAEAAAAGYGLPLAMLVCHFPHTAAVAVPAPPSPSSLLPPSL